MSQSERARYLTHMARQLKQAAEYLLPCGARPPDPSKSQELFEDALKGLMRL
jgi:hypothetical protein